MSGLSAVIGDMLISFQAMPAWALVLVLCLLTVALTTFTSNVATATIFMPILAELVSSVLFVCEEQILRYGLLITLPVMMMMMMMMMMTMGDG